MAQNWSLIVPEETENLCTNPSFEKATTGWTATSSNTIARSAAQQYAGVYSLLCTYQNSTTLATLAISSGLAAAITYTITARLFVPANWDGGDIRLNASGFTSATVTQVREWDSATGETNKWVELEIRLATSSDATGTILLQTTGAPSAGRTVYLDAVQIEEKSYPTTYCDGDQQGCSWNGVAHAATSSRDQFEASGGRLRNLDTDFEFLTGLDEGTGVFPLQMLSHPQPLLPGDSFQGINVQSRSNLLLRGGFEGETTPDLHAKRQALIKALNSRVGPINRPPQARQLIYHGAAVEKQIGVHYVAGLGVKDRIGTLGERIDGLQFYAPDPAWYGRGERGVALDVNDTDSFVYLFGRTDGSWNDLGGPVINQRVSSLVYDDTYIYIGGYFSNFDGNASADYIVRYNRLTGAYSSLSTGANSFVYALAIGPDGSLYAGGAFTSIGGVTVTGIAKWDGSAWSKLGSTGVSGSLASVSSIEFGPDGNLYIGGQFTSVNGVSATNVAKWNGSSWSAMGAGASGLVGSFAFDKAGNIYVGGSFTSAGGDSDCSRIAKWDGSNWISMNGGFSNGAVSGILVTDSGSVVVSGTFTLATAGAYSIRDAAEWNGSRWVQIEEIPFDVGGSALVSNGLLYTFGDRGVFVWEGRKWVPLGLYMGVTPSVSSILEIGDDIFIGGNFSVTASFGGNIAVEYDGTESAYPVLVVSRSGGSQATLYTLRNETTGAIINLNYSLLDGETITIDLRPSHLSVTSSDFGSVPAAILPGSDTASFYLTPGNSSGAQENLISCYVYHSGSPTITAVMRWRDTYQSYD